MIEPTLLANVPLLLMDPAAIPLAPALLKCDQQTAFEGVDCLSSAEKTLIERQAYGRRLI